MNFDLTEDQTMMRDMFARFLDENSSMERVRAAQSTGFDQNLWKGLAELGAFSMRVPEDKGGLGMGLFDATILMEEAGRTLVSGPLAEVLVAARLLSQFGNPDSDELLEKLLSGSSVVSIAMQDVTTDSVQWIAGGAVAEAVIACKGSDVMLVAIPESARVGEPDLGFTPIAELDLSVHPQTVLSSGPKAKNTFEAAIEEWKLLIASQLSGLSRQSLKLAAEYACERKQFGQLIGAYQAISHPLADCLCEVDTGKLLLWKAIRDIADQTDDAGTLASLAFWWNSKIAANVVTRSLHTFGGYGLTTEYDIHLYNLRAKAWPLVIGDPNDILEEAGRRRYGGEAPSLPDVGDVPIDFDLGQDALAIKDEIRDFFEKNITPEMREKFHYSWEGYNPEINKMLSDNNLLYLAMPKELGGRGLSPYARTAAMEAFEETGYKNPATSVTEMVAVMIQRYGSDELKEQVIPKILAGEVICSLGYSEPGSGSDVFAAQCKAVRDGDGWRIDGTKMFTSGANLADYVIMLNRTNTEAPKHKGLTMFLVPLKTDGITIQPVYTFQDERTNITFYDGVKIPDSYRLGEVDGGVRVMAAALELEHGGSMSIPMFSMLDAAEELCRTTRRRGKFIIESPNAQARLVRSYANAVVSELLAYRSNWAATEKKHGPAWGPMAKMFSSELFQTDARDLLDLLAPLSLARREGAVHEVNLAYSHAQATTIYAGTSEVHRSMIAEKALGLPRTRA